MLVIQCNWLLSAESMQIRAETIVEQFDRLTSLVGIEEFRKIFLVILTDNGSEFKHTKEFETTTDGEKSVVFNLKKPSKYAAFGYFTIG